MMTTAPEAKARIVTLLQAWPGLNGLPVMYGRPTRDAQIPQGRQFIALGDVTEAEGAWAALGNRRTQENYLIAIYIALQVAGDSEQAAEQTAADTLAEVNKAIKSDSTLGGLLYGPTAFLTRGSLQSFPTDQPIEGFAVEARGQIACEARVTSTP